jgi:hypothetical protein
MGIEIPLGYQHSNYSLFYYFIFNCYIKILIDYLLLFLINIHGLLREYVYPYLLLIYFTYYYLNYLDRMVISYSFHCCRIHLKWIHSYFFFCKRIFNYFILYELHFMKLNRLNYLLKLIDYIIL